MIAVRRVLALAFFALGALAAACDVQVYRYALERWAADPGMQTWSYAHCLPYFKRMETCLAGQDAWRGGDGPLVLERGPATNPLFDAFFAATVQAGYPRTDDVNGYRQEGFAPFDRNIHN